VILHVCRVFHAFSPRNGRNSEEILEKFSGSYNLGKVSLKPCVYV
jgi:hypothetical protein